MAQFRFSRSVIVPTLLGALLVAPSINSQVAVTASDAEIIKYLLPELNDVQLMTMQDLTAEQIDNIGNTPEVGRRFEGDFNADGQPDLALMGSNPDGTFVLLATRDQAVWHRSGLLQASRPFVVGRLDQDVLRYFFCTGCDSGMRVAWTGREYELLPFPPLGVPRDSGNQ